MLVWGFVLVGMVCLKVGLMAVLWGTDIMMVVLMVDLELWVV